MQPFLDTFCWCLLLNHFHFLVRVKTYEEIKNYFGSLPAETLKPVEKNYVNNKATAELLIEFEWKRFFTSYSMAFNKQHQRTGNLFNRPFKRINIDKDSYFTQAIVYIHANAFSHKLCKDFTKYKWSSWHSILSEQPTQLCRQEVLELFGGSHPFIEAHKKMIEYYYSNNVAIEEAEQEERSRDDIFLKDVIS